MRDANGNYVERLSKLGYHLIYLYIFVSAFVYVAYVFGFFGDATDGPNGRPSFLTLYTDNGTGCEYLGRSGALTPRLRADGKQTGCR